MRTVVHFLILFICLLPDRLHCQDTILVPEDYATIQSALSAASTNALILVSPGTYVENLSWPSVKGIQLRGNSGSDSTIVDGNQAGRVLTKITSGQDAGSLIEGLTLRNGLSNDDGGGLYISGRGTRLRDLVISDNTANQNSYGGGMYLLGYSGIIEQCTIQGNEALASQQARGGGLHLSSDGPVEFHHCRFSGNQSRGTNSSYGGGVSISNSVSEPVLFRNCAISGNSTNDDTHSRGAGMYIGPGPFVIDSCYIGGNSTGNATNEEGGGIFTTSTQFTVSNSQIFANRADHGAAVIFDSNDPAEIYFLNSWIDGNTAADQFAETIIEVNSPSSKLEFRNCIIGSNEGTAIRISNSFFPATQVLMNHSTVAYNYRAFDVRVTSLDIRNSILWNGQEFVFDSWHEEKVRSSVVKGGFVGGGNIDSDPLFRDIWDLTPEAGSPCFGAGNPAFSEAQDIFGNHRPIPTNTPPDIGAIEINQSRSVVHTKFYYDINENGMRDTSERYAQIGAVEVNDNETYVNFRADGLVIGVDTGLLDVAYANGFHSGWHVTSEPVFSTHIDTAEFFELVEFGIAPVAGETELATYITANPFRCNESVRINITVSSENSYSNHALLWLQLDEHIESFIFDLPPDTSLGTQLIGWYVSELFPTESFTYSGTLDAPGIGGDVQPGDTFSFRAWIEGLEDETAFEYDAVLRCSYDPNDKLINPNRADSVAFIDEHLFYTIRFQNTGNDYARHVTITDTLDKALDHSTFRLISTSHPANLEVTFPEEHVIRFTFLDIFLPDSTTHFDASNGFVSYRISAFPDIIVGTEIKNTADIYFDLNPAIVTNTTVSIMRDNVSTINLPTEIFSRNLAYPNPTNGILYLKDLAEDIWVYNCNGVQLFHDQGAKHINLGPFPEGVYVLRLVFEGNYNTQKVVKIR